MPQTTLERVFADSQARSKKADQLFGNAVTEVEWAAVAKKVRKFEATKKQLLPHGEDELGVDAPMQVQVGTKFQYSPAKTKGGRKLNSLLRPYGFRPLKDGMDADHVVEIQLIGLSKGDYLGNLWPLRAEDNRHGLALADSEIEMPGPEGKKMKLSAAAKKKTKPWIMIKRTE